MCCPTCADKLDEEHKQEVEDQQAESEHRMASSIKKVRVYYDKQMIRLQMLLGQSLEHTVARRRAQGCNTQADVAHTHLPSVAPVLLIFSIVRAHQDERAGAARRRGARRRTGQQTPAHQVSTPQQAANAAAMKAATQQHSHTLVHSQHLSHSKHGAHKRIQKSTNDFI